MNKKIIISIIIFVLIGGGAFGAVKYNQNIKEKARIEAEKEEQARIEAEKEEQAKKVGTYKAEAHAYYDEHKKDFIFEPDMTREKFTDDYVALRQADKTSDEAIESIRSAYWVVTYLENEESVYVSVEDGADFYDSPVAEEAKGTFDYCSEQKTIGVVEKYNEQKQMKEVMYLFTWDEAEDIGYVEDENYEPKTIHVNAVSNIANFTTEITEQMQARLDAQKEETIEIHSIADRAKLDGKYHPDGTAESQDPAREVPFVAGTMIDLNTGRDLGLGGYNGDGYYGNNCWVSETKGHYIIARNKLDYEECQQVIRDFATGARISDEEASRRAAEEQAGTYADPTTWSFSDGFQ